MDIEGEDGASAPALDIDERFRAFAENTGDVLWIAEAGNGRLTYISPAFEAIWGEQVSAMIADPDRWQACLHPEDRETALLAWHRAIAGERVMCSYRIVRPSDQTIRWIRDAGFPIRDPDGAVRRVGGIARDVTDGVRARDEGRMLVDELQHRVRNILGLVRTLARRTADVHRDIDAFLAHFEGRLATLARFQSFASRHVAPRTDLEDLIREELLAQAADAKRLSISGPRVQLDQKSAQVLALALHELANNATKFGALLDTGAVAVSWKVVRAGDPQWLELIWSERFPATLPAGPPGFGTDHIERAIAFDLGGTGSLEIRDHGAEARIAIPLDGPALRAVRG